MTRWRSSRSAPRSRSFADALAADLSRGETRQLGDLSARVFSLDDLIGYKRVIGRTADLRELESLAVEGPSQTLTRRSPAFFDAGRRPFENQREPLPQFRIDKVVDGPKATLLRYAR